MTDQPYIPLPEDPPGWRIELDDDGKWHPTSPFDLGPFDTKQAAVDAIYAAEQVAPST